MTKEEILKGMTDDQLKQQIAVLTDMVNMLNNNIPTDVIGKKYGFYPDSTRSAVNDINMYKAELQSRGITVQDAAPVKSQAGKNVKVLVISAIVIVVILGLMGKLKSKK